MHRLLSSHLRVSLDNNFADDWAEGWRDLVERVCRGQG